MDAPEYLICLNCETPCYSFEWRHGLLQEVLCLVCGNENRDEFMTEEDYDSMVSADAH